MEDEPLQVPTGVQTRVFTPFTQSLHGPQVPLASDTFTSTQRLQLLPSSDSLINPPPALDVLSAQARTEYVPTAENVCDLVVVLLKPKFKAGMAVAARSVGVAQPPPGTLHIWKKL